MRGLSRSYLLLVTSIVLVVCTSVWAYDMYLEVDGVPGECNQSHHLNWIEAYAFSHSVTGIGPSNAFHASYSVTKRVDKATPLLYLHACNGETIAVVTFDVFGPDGSILTVTLNNATVAQISTEGSSTNTYDSPVETVEFDYDQIQWSYQEYDLAGMPHGGPVVTCWNVTNNAPCP